MTIDPKQFALGWKRDLPDVRDHVFSAPIAPPPVFPPVHSIKGGFPSVYNQGSLGSCTANATAAAFAYTIIRQGLPEFDPSRLFIYYNTRSLEGTTDYDAGATIRDSIKSVKTYGACKESELPYVISTFRDKPAENLYTEALEKVVTAYQRLDRNLIAFKTALLSELPVVIGFSVYSSFYGVWPKVTIAPIPSPKDRLVGGHAVLIVGYDDKKQAFLVRNSWGADWKLQGYFYLPYVFITNPRLSADFWSIISV